MRPLFKLGSSTRSHPDVAKWFDDHQGDLGDLALHWFEVVRHCGDDVTEVLHDGQPTACVDGAAFAYVDAFTAHVNLGFFQGAELTDPAGLLQGAGKHMRHVKLYPSAQVHEAALSLLILTAYDDIKRRLAVEVEA